MPDDDDLANQFGEWVPDEAMRKKILVEKPARLYGF
jgi:predicted TIM-barrel fold metal-dependent hydrolase